MEQKKNTTKILNIYYIASGQSTIGIAKTGNLGHFLSAILRNDLSEATSRADNVNVKMLDIYAKFLYNVVPSNYKEKI